MASHRSSRGRRRRRFGVASTSVPGSELVRFRGTALPAAHRLPRPNPASRGTVLTAAVAAGAMLVAGHSLQASAAGQTDAAGTPGTAGSTQVTGVASVALTSSSPASEVVLVPAAASPAPGTDLQALGRAVERADRAAAQAAYAAVVRDRLGKPYRAGNNHSLDGWIAKALGLMGLPQALAPGVKKIIMHESTGNPNAINRWDSNFARGTPSQGLMQTIPATFKACVLPGLRDRPITDPVANITAGLRSMIAHHGVSAVLGGGRRDADGNYRGYGGSGCSYDISRYEDQLQDLWADEPLPES